MIPLGLIICWRCPVTARSALSGILCVKPSSEYALLFRFKIKHVSGLGNRSPPRGGGEGGAANQQILVSSSDDGSEGGFPFSFFWIFIHDKQRQCGYGRTEHLCISGQAMRGLIAYLGQRSWHAML